MITSDIRRRKMRNQILKWDTLPCFLVLKPEKYFFTRVCTKVLGSFMILPEVKYTYTIEVMLIGISDDI